VGNVGVSVADLILCISYFVL